MWKTLRALDLTIAVVLVLLGVAGLIATAQMRVGAAAQLQPRLFPSAVSWLLVLTGAGLLLNAWRSRSDAAVDWPDRAGAIRVAVSLASVVVFLLLIGPLGFPIGTFLLITFLVWYLGHYRWYVPPAVGLASAAAVYFVFMQTLGLELPVGDLFEPD
jgi:putative tricarboxylic transport membrane protein